MTQDKEAPITMREAAGFFAGGVTDKTVRKYCNIGLRGVVLDSWFDGGIKVTSAAAIEQFKAAYTAKRTGRRKTTKKDHKAIRDRLRVTHGV